MQKSNGAKAKATAEQLESGFENHENPGIMGQYVRKPGFAYYRDLAGLSSETWNLVGVIFSSIHKFPLDSF